MKSIWNQVAPMQGNDGAIMPQEPPNMANSQASLNSPNSIDPFSRGQYYGRVYDPRSQISGHEANVLGLLRQQDI